MDPAPCRSTVRHVLVDRACIGFLRFTLEAYEGIATVSTVDPTLGLVRLSMAPGCEGDVERILESESRQLGLRLVEWASPGGDPDREGRAL